MSYLADTNILVRIADHLDPLHLSVTAAVAKLHRQGEVLSVTAQNLVELWNVLTRPKRANGIGMTPAAAEQFMSDVERNFAFVPDSPDVFVAWRQMVVALSVIGKQTHDARLAAVCQANGITHLLTLNVADFTRFAGYGPGLIIVDPQTV